MSAKRSLKPAHIEAPRPARCHDDAPVNESFRPPLYSAPRARCWLRVALVLCAGLALLTSGAARAQSESVDTWRAQIEQLAQQAGSGAPADARIEVEVGTLDPRLKLAPCARITPYLPAGMRLWGRAQVGLRCSEGARWSVFLPVTVKVFATAWSVVQPITVGTVLSAAHVQREVVDLAAESSPAVTQLQAAIGRAAARTLRPGQALREADLRPRQWFAPGDTVRVLTVGAGFAISAEGQAMGPGIDGQLTKVRTEGGRVVSGRATAARQVEVAL
jgi:flagella basal body P-ring formation protein FlgA